MSGGRPVQLVAEDDLLAGAVAVEQGDGCAVVGGELGADHAHHGGDAAACRDQHRPLRRGGAGVEGARGTRTESRSPTRTCWCTWAEKRPCSTRLTVRCNCPVPGTEVAE